MLVLDIEDGSLEGRFETLEDGAIDSFSVENVDAGGVRMAEAGPGTGGDGDPVTDDEGVLAPGPGVGAFLVAAMLAAGARRG